MIDSTRSPRPLWRRITNLILLLTAIVLAVWVIWVKELHHTNVHIHAVSPVLWNAIGAGTGLS